MKTEIKEFIKEQHAEACSERKAKIEEKFPELFKSEIELGKWYKSNNGTLLCVTEIEKEYCKGYGFFGYMKEWVNNKEKGYVWKDSHLTPTTDKEVKDALIAEAKRRGFKNIGEITIKPIVGSVYLKGEFVTIKNDYEFRNFNLFLDGVLIFHDGKWATIIEEEEEIISIKELREKIQIIKAELQSLKELLK